LTASLSFFDLSTKKEINSLFGFHYHLRDKIEFKKGKKDEVAIAFRNSKIGLLLKPTWNGRIISHILCTHSGKSNEKVLDTLDFGMLASKL